LREDEKEIHAMVLTAPGTPLRLDLREDPVSGPLVLHAVRKGGRAVCAGIHMLDIPSFPYHVLWKERQVVSVADLTRSDGWEFFRIAAQAGIRTHTTALPLREANEVLARLRAGQITGAAVLQP
jgi:propanol-preferring alcohol dehydrogenase